MTNTATLDDALINGFAPQALLNQTVGEKYVIREIIARGGTSVVYKAQDKALGRMVALKLVVVPRTTMSPLDEKIIQRFKREGKSLAQMEHPNIVPVFDTGIDKCTLSHYDVYYIAMKLMEGETLDERLGKLQDSDERLAWRKVLAIIQDVAAALDYVHGHEFDFVHRDVTPSNIILVEDNAYLFDFGLVKVLSFPADTAERETFVDFRKSTVAGMAMGTPAYWAPEQIKGSEIDHRTDIYGLGGVLHRMVTGQLPYKDDPRGLTGHLQEPPPKPSSVNPALFPFDPIVARAMAKNPDERYQSAGEFAQALEAALAPTPNYTRGKELAKAQDIARIIPRWLGGLLAILVVILIGIRYLNWFQPPLSLPLGWQPPTVGVSMVAEGDNDYVVSVTGDNASYAVFREGEGLEKPNVSVEVEQTGGPRETAYGLVFQYVDDSNYYVFAITDSGQVGIWQRRDGRPIALTERWTDADQAWVSQKYILADKSNRIEITIEGNRASGWINYQPVFVDRELDGTYPGNVGFFVSTSRDAEDPEAEIRFSNFTVRK